MTKLQFALFFSGLILPALYQRMKFAWFRESFYVTKLRDKSGLNIHHGHWGLAMVFFSLFMLVFGLHNWVSIGLAGFGIGLILDEIVPMFKMPTFSRNLELEVYEKSRNGTIVLIGIAAALSVLMFFAWR